VSMGMLQFCRAMRERLLPRCTQVNRLRRV
jgi:hypothetical protein